MKTNRIRGRVVARIAAATAAVLLLAGCILQPNGEETGSLALSIPASISGAAIDAGDWADEANTARVWMYKDGAEYRLTAAGEEEEANFVEANLTGSGATVVINDIPEDDGYSVVIVLGRKASDTEGVFVPLSYADTGEFSVIGGRDTEVSATRINLDAVDGDAGQLDDADFALLSEELNSVVRVGSSVFAGTPTGYFEDFGSGFGDEVAIGSWSTGASTVLSISPGVFAEDNFALINTDRGVLPVAPGGETALTEIASTLDSAGAKNVTFSGTFSPEGSSTETVLFYQRKGGLGGGLVTALVPSVEAEWVDSGTELEDYVDADESPVRAQATSGRSTGYFATVLGTFQLDEQLFEGEEIEVGEILDPENNTSGLQFFGVTYPGTSRPLRISQFAIVDDYAGGEHLFVGTLRGGFLVPTKVISDGDLAQGNVVKAGDRVQIDAVRDQRIVDANVAGDYLVITTDQSVVILDTTEDVTTDAAVVLDVPVRASVLGAPRDISVAVNGGSLTMYVAGTEGLSVLTKTVVE